MPSAPVTVDLVGVLWVFLLVLWIDADRRSHPQVGQSFDYGFLVWMYWLPYIPYYLWRTRGAAGLWMFVGFLGLFSLGSLVQLVILLVLSVNQQFIALPR
jgi:hypothetical protein